MGRPAMQLSPILQAHESVQPKREEQGQPEAQPLMEEAHPQGAEGTAAMIRRGARGVRGWREKGGNKSIEVVYKQNNMRKKW